VRTWKKIFAAIVSAAFLVALTVVMRPFYSSLWGRRSDSLPIAASGQGQAAARQGDRATTDIPVAALGRIEPQSGIINLGASALPDRLETLLVERGDLVKKDQVLGYLGAYAEQVAQRDVFRAQLDEAKQRLKAATKMDLARIEGAQIHQRQVEDVAPFKIAAQEAIVASLDAKLTNDKDNLETDRQLSADGLTSRRLRNNQKSVVLQGEANLKSARDRLAELKRQYELDKVEAATQVALARATLERAQADIPIASLEKQIELADARARTLTLHAPVDGRILNVIVKPGEQVGRGPILTMGDTGKMRVVAEIYETDISRVRLGEAATITSRALAKRLTGRVVRIGSMIFKNDVLNVDPAARADARVVEVWIELDDGAPAERLTNLTVDVIIAVSDGAAPEAAIARSATP
jgi:HlyD family secretion protein